MTREAAFSRLEEIDRESTMLAHVAAVLEWDSELYAPMLESEERGRQMGYLQTEIHKRETSSEMGDLLSVLEGYGTDDFEKALIRIHVRAYQRGKALSPHLVSLLSQAKTKGYACWIKAREDNDFASFAPVLEEILSLTREVALAYADGKSGLYDALLDSYEEGMTSVEVDALFAVLKPVLVSLVDERMAHPVDDAFLRKPYDVGRQDAFALCVMTDMGFDFNRGLRGISVHPFTSALGVDDVRVTTRYTDPSVMDSFFSSVHECGHAIYEQAASQGREKGTSIAGGASYGMHESQSRLWENIIGRSRPFWMHYYPLFCQTFPDQTEGVSFEAFYHAVNKVDRTPIRTNADEVSYSLHIMLRYELEKALVSGDLQVKDLPGAWDEMSRNLLGLEISDDRMGCLQDVHWASGDIGYFPTYALGNLYGAQIWAALKKELDADALLEQGDLASIASWLKRNVYVKGMLYPPKTLLRGVTGSSLDPAPYVAYLKEKYRTSW
jgi:carboxypeptidase Taq